MDASTLWRIILDFTKQVSLARDTILYTSALFISILTLWFTHLKGPDIDLSSQIKTELIDWSQKRVNEVTSDYIPRYLEISPINLVFINNGSRAGAITEIIIEFKPNEDFKPFYKEISTRLSNLPISVNAGETGIINVRLSIQPIDWRQNINKDYIKSSENIKKSVFLSLEDNKKLFVGFVEFMSSNKDLGQIDIFAEYSKMKWFRVKLKTNKIGSTNLTNNCYILIDFLNNCLMNWDTESYTNYILGNIAPGISSLIGILELNIGILEGDIISKTYSRLNNLDLFWRTHLRLNSIVYLLFERHKQIKNELGDLNHCINKYNANVLLIGSMRGIVEEQLMSINKEREELLSKIKSIKETLEFLTINIKKEIQTYETE